MLELSSVEINFERMLQRVINITGFRADEKKQKISVNVDKSIPVLIIGDEQRLAQVITNLLGNAVKFTPDGGSIKVNTCFLGKEMCSTETGVNWNDISVMAVDDDIEILDYFKDIMNNSGAECITELSGKEALSHAGYKKRLIFILLTGKCPVWTDMKLPRKSVHRAG